MKSCPEEVVAIIGQALDESVIDYYAQRKISLDEEVTTFLIFNKAANSTTEVYN